MASPTRYPDYDVMSQAEHWDPHTREVVQSRFSAFPTLKLSPEEIGILTCLAAVLVDDDDPGRLNFVVAHADNQLNSPIGESQRKEGLPPQSELIRQGIRAANETANNYWGKPFSGLSLPERQTLLGNIEREEYKADALWQGIPQKDFFKALLALVVQAYFSHPSVWSEIGYGGPAYPRGYVRSELGLVDPWEARREE